MKQKWLNQSKALSAATAVALLTFWQSHFLTVVAAETHKCPVEHDEVDNTTGVTLPTFQFERALFTHCAVDDEEMHSCSSLPRPLELRRAKNLLATGHFSEAIDDYQANVEHFSGLPWEKEEEYREYGLAFEKLGELKQALQCYRQGAVQDQMAKLLIRLGQFVEAEAITSKRIAELNAIDEKNQGGGYGEIPTLYRLRAAASEGLGQHSAAVSDLSEAAKLYLKSDFENVNICTRDANKIIETSKLGSPFSLTAADLPQVGKVQVSELLHFMTSAENPFSIRELNKLAHAHIKIPGETFKNNFQERHLTAWLKSLEYRTSDDDYEFPESVEFSIATNKCCLAKSIVMRFLPPNLPHNPQCVGFLGHRLYAESFLLPGGNILNLTFGEGGVEILNDISVVSADTQSHRVAKFNPADSLFCEASRAASATRPCGVTTSGLETAVTLYSKAIAIDSDTPEYYRDKARVLTKLARYEEALADSNVAIKIGGRPFVAERAAVEEASGNYKDAIADLRQCLLNHEPGPETRELRLSLSEVLLKDNQFTPALQAANDAMVNTTNTTRAVYLRGRAEAGLGNLVAARKDGNTAAKEYFAQARIVYREEVIKWLASLPPENDTSCGAVK